MNKRIVTLAIVAVASCGPVSPEELETFQQEAVNGSNGLSMINGLSMTNGLAMTNGLSMTNGLAMTNGLQSGVGMMTSSAGRQTLSYMVRCALPAGKRVSKQDQYGTWYNFDGQIGVAPQWEWGACDAACQEGISACMLAHVNTTGTNIPIYMVSRDSAIGGGRDSAYPNFEGAFFGNIFSSPPRAYYCRGRDSDVNTVPGRLGDNNRNGEPYQNPWGQQAFCSNYCTGENDTERTYSSCNGFTRVVSTWRQAYAGSYGSVVAPTYAFEGSTQNWGVRHGNTGAAPIGGATWSTTSQKYSGSSSLAATINGGAGQYYVGIAWPSTSNMAGKTIVMSVWYPANLPLTGIQPYVQEDGSKGWRFTSNWQYRNWIRPGQWNTISVRVPSDAGPVHQIGFQVITENWFNGQVYVDAVTF